MTDRNPLTDPMAGDVLNLNGSTIALLFVNQDGVVCFNRHGAEEGHYCYGLGDWRALVETATVVREESGRFAELVGENARLREALKLARSMLPKLDPELADASLYAQIDATLNPPEASTGEIG